MLDFTFCRGILLGSAPQLVAGAVGMVVASMCMVAMPLLGSEFIKELIQGNSFRSASKVRSQASGPENSAADIRHLPYTVWVAERECEPPARGANTEASLQLSLAPFFFPARN